MRAVIYARVSSQGQEDGASLPEQLEGCLAKAKELGYDVPPDNILREIHSASTLDRPQLNTLRDWARNGQIDTVICFKYDRLSRDPVDFIVLQDELEKRNVKLILVKETLDDTDEGKLILHVKGYAAKIERKAILERKAVLYDGPKTASFPVAHALGFSGITTLMENAISMKSRRQSYRICSSGFWKEPA